jgi:hypothetical protein
MILVPSMPRSKSDARIGEFGLKYGPSICDGVRTPSSPQAGVARALGTWARVCEIEVITKAAGTATDTPKNCRRL